MKKILVSIIFVLVLFISVKAQMLPAYVPKSGLVGWWQFNGNANDLSGKGNNGNVNGAILVTDRNGIKNSAYGFDGKDDYISTDKWFSGKNNNYTISLWINIDSQSISPTDKSIILHRADWSDKVIFWSNTPRSIVASDRNGGPVTGISNINIKRDNWEHLVMVSTSTTISIYINDSLSYSTQRTTQSNWDSLYKGSYFGGNGFDTWQGSFHGKLDDIGIWNRALNKAEIKILFESCSSSLTKNPDNITVNSGKNAQMIVETPNQFAKFQWQTDFGVGFQNMTNSGQYSGANNDTLVISNTTPSNNNQKFRCVISSGNCKDTSTAGILKINNIGTIDIRLNDKFIIYPIPIIDELNINVEQKNIGSLFIISNSLGQNVVSGILTAEKSVLNLSHLPYGIYYLKIGEQNQRTFKILKFE